MLNQEIEMNRAQKELLMALGRTGAISSVGAETQLRVSLQRINYLINAELICRGKAYYPKEGLISYFCLGEKGRRYLQRQCGCEYIYRFSHRQVMHDLKLGGFYLDLDDETRSTWITENEILNVLIPKITVINTVRGAIDAIIKKGSYLYGVEAITRNYSREEIKQKEEIAHRLNCCSLILI